MPFKFKPIREDEGLSWAEFLAAVAETPPRVSEPQPLTFAEAPDEPKVKTPPLDLDAQASTNPAGRVG